MKDEHKGDHKDMQDEHKNAGREQHTDASRDEHHDEHIAESHDAVGSNNRPAVADGQHPITEPAPAEPAAALSATPVEPNPFNQPAVPVAAPPVAPATPAAPQPAAAPVPPVQTPVLPAQGEYRGLKGWLAFFMIILGLDGIGALGLFVSALATLIEGDGTAATVVAAVGMPVVGVTMLMAAVNIATRKRFGKTMSQVAIIAMAIVMTIIGLTNVVDTVSDAACDCGSSYYYRSDPVCDCYGPTSSEKAAAVVEGVGAIVIQLVVYGLSVTYFQQSRRVRDTLVE